MATVSCEVISIFAYKSSKTLINAYSISNAVFFATPCIFFHAQLAGVLYEAVD